MPASLAITVRSALRVSTAELSGGDPQLPQLARENLEVGRSVHVQPTLWFRTSRHERVVRDGAAGCEVVDRWVVEPRLPGLAVFALPVLARQLERRHRLLRSAFGSPQTDAPRAERTLGAGAEQEAALVVGGAVVSVAIVAGVIAFMTSRKRR